MEIACEPTGVKYLHHRALDFDVGIYFEANGHGTVIFSPTATECIRQAAHDSMYLQVEIILLVLMGVR